MFERFRGRERYSHKDAMDELQREVASVLDIAAPEGGSYRVAVWKDYEGRTCRLESTTTIVTQLPASAGKVLRAYQNNHFTCHSGIDGIPTEYKFKSNEKGIHFCDESGAAQSFDPTSAQRIPIATMLSCLEAFPKERVGAWDLDYVDWELDQLEADHKKFEQKIARKVLGLDFGPSQEKIHEQFAGDQYMINRYFEKIDESAS